MNPLYAMMDRPVNTRHEDYPEKSIYYLNNFLYNSLGYTGICQERLGFPARNGQLVDIKTRYHTNNFGFRCKDWTNASEILTVGCSVTYGLGVSDNGSWPRILEKLSNKNVHNLSRPGLSIQELVFQVFAYFKKFGNPETVVCLFPDPFRMVIPIKNGFVGIGKESLKKLDNGPFATMQLNKYSKTKIADRKKYLKAPYDYEDFMPMEVPLFFSMMAIHMLEQYCNSNNIKLIWSSWDMQVLEVFNELEEIPFTNFIHSKEFITDSGIDRRLGCHEKYDGIEDRYFHSGQDIEGGKEYSHCGVHRHLHIAEEFYKKLNLI